MKDIADDFGIYTEEVLTGFKYIGEKIKIQEELKSQGKPYKEYIFGGEESYGTLAGTFVRDKDAVIACSLFAEMVAYLMYNNKTVLQYLDEIYKKYGYYAEALKSIAMQGVEGAEKIKHIMARFRNNPPEKIGNWKVIKVGDIQKSELRNILENKVECTYDLPKSNVIILFLENNIKITLRPSGTEPKIKFYFAMASKNTTNLAETKKKVNTQLQEIIKEFLKFVQK